MLFLLTGDIQTGKTRWLTRLVEQLTASGVSCYGLLSPGVWRKSKAPDGTTEYEKRGIESLLLPEGERLPFARRRDLVLLDNDYDSNWQSMRAGLGWVIPDQALTAVNEHFDKLAEKIAVAESSPVSTWEAAPDCRWLENRALSTRLSGRDAKTMGPNQHLPGSGLLLVDELGRLELDSSGGFTSAVKLLEAGPSPLYDHAVVVVRSVLAARARRLLADAWNEARLVYPDDASGDAIKAALRARASGATAAIPLYPL